MKTHDTSARRARSQSMANSPVAAPTQNPAPTSVTAQAPFTAQAWQRSARHAARSRNRWLPLTTMLGGHLLMQLLAPSATSLPILQGEEPLAAARGTESQQPPATQPPATQTPATQTPATQTPATQTPATQTPAASTSVTWQTDLAAAQALAAQSHRPLLLHFTSDHCPPCQRMEKTVFVDPQVNRVMGEHFVAVKINVERQPDVARSYRVDRWPTDIICAPDGKELTRGTSEQQPARFIAKLQHFAPTAHPMAKTKWNEPAIRPVNLATPDPTPPQLPLGLDGFCPVTLMQQKSWKKGDSQWGAIHRERVYWFAGAAEQQRFLANPDAYSPALAGFDIVRFVELRQRVDGRRQHGVWHRGQMFLFADEATLNQFTADAASYLERGEQLLQESASAAHTTPPSAAPDRRGPERQ